MAIKEITIKDWLENGGRTEKEFETFMGYMGFSIPLNLKKVRFNEFQINGTDWIISVKYGDGINEPNYCIIYAQNKKEVQVYYMNNPEVKFPFYRL